MDTDSGTAVSASRERESRRYIASTFIDAMMSDASQGAAAQGIAEGTADYSTVALDQKVGRAGRRAAARLIEEASVEPLRAALITRALNAVAQIAAELPTLALTEAVSAPSDYDALVRALGAALSVAPNTDDISDEQLLLQARLRGVRARRRILASEGGSMTSSAVAEHLGISRQAVDERRKKGRLLGLQSGGRAYAYPAWQFAKEGVLPGLQEVLAVLAHWGSWTQASFLLNPNSRLRGNSPLQELRAGHGEKVLWAAQAYGEHGS